jgi:hypothetical protein
MKNIDINDLQVIDSAELAPLNGQTPYREVPTIPFRVWANDALTRANPQLPSLGLPATLAKRFQLIDVDGVLQPKTKFKEVAGYKIPLINSLTAGESLFAGWFATEVQGKQGEIDAIFRIIAANIRKEFPELGLSAREARMKAWEVVNGTPVAKEKEELENLKKQKLADPVTEEQAADHQASIAKEEARIAELETRFDEFAESQADNIRDIYKISNTAADPKSQNILFSAFLIASRVDPSITIPDLTSMGMDEIEELSGLWKLENNKGVPPEEPKPEPEATSEDSPEGKEKPEATETAGTEEPAT